MNQYQLQPIASPVETFVAPVAPVNQKPEHDTGLEDLATSLGLGMEVGVKVNDVMLKQGQAAGEQLYNENQKSWNEYVKANPDKKYLNPYIKVGYDQAKVKSDVYNVLAEIRAEQPNMGHLTPQEFEGVIGKKVQTLFDNMKQEGISPQIINSAIPQLNQYKQQLTTEHAYKYGEYKFNQTKNITADNINKNITDVYKLVPNTALASERETYFGKVFTQGIDDVVKAGGSVEDGIETVFNGIKANLYSRTDLTTKDLEAIKNSLKTTQYGGQELSRYKADIMKDVTNLSNTYLDSQLETFVKQNQLKEYQKKQVVSKIESTIYTMISDPKQATPENIELTRKKVLTLATEADVVDEVRTLNGFLLDHVKTLQGLKEPLQSDSNTLMMIHNKVISGRTNNNEIMTLARQGKLSTSDAIQEMSFLRSVNEDNEGEARSAAEKNETKGRYKQLKSYYKLGKASVDELTSDFQFKYNPQVKNLEAKFEKLFYLEELAGGNGSESYNELEKTVRLLKDKKNITPTKAIPLNLPKLNVPSNISRTSSGINLPTIQEIKRAGNGKVVIKGTSNNGRKQ